MSHSHSGYQPRHINMAGTGYHVVIRHKSIDKDSLYRVDRDLQATSGVNLDTSTPTRSWCISGYNTSVGYYIYNWLLTVQALVIYHDGKDRCRLQGQDEVSGTPHYHMIVYSNNKSSIGCSRAYRTLTSKIREQGGEVRCQAIASKMSSNKTYQALPLLYRYLSVSTYKYYIGHTADWLHADWMMWIGDLYNNDLITNAMLTAWAVYTYNFPAWRTYQLLRTEVKDIQDKLRILIDEYVQGDRIPHGIVVDNPDPGTPRYAEDIQDIHARDIEIRHANRKQSANTSMRDAASEPVQGPSIADIDTDNIATDSQMSVDNSVEGTPRRVMRGRRTRGPKMTLGDKVRTIASYLLEHPEIDCYDTLCTTILHDKKMDEQLISSIMAQQGEGIYVRADIDNKRQYNGKTLYDLLPDKPSGSDHHYLYTYGLLLKWCQELGLNPIKVTYQIYMWLTQRDNKINMLYLSGTSNTNKSFWARSLSESISPRSRLGAVSAGASEFKYQDCVNKTVILWEEAKITPGDVDTVKCIAEGTYVKVPVKYAEPKEIRRTPIVCTTNHTLIRLGLSHEHIEALENRMYHIKCTKNVNTIDKHILSKFQNAQPLTVDPYMWYMICKYYQDKMREIQDTIMDMEPDILNVDELIEKVKRAQDQWFAEEYVRGDLSDRATRMTYLTWYMYKDCKLDLPDNPMEVLNTDPDNWRDSKICKEYYSIATEYDNSDEIEIDEEVARTLTESDVVDKIPTLKHDITVDNAKMVRQVSDSLATLMRADTVTM